MTEGKSKEYMKAWVERNPDNGKPVDLWLKPPAHIGVRVGVFLTDEELSELHQRIKALEAEREQIAREAWEDGNKALGIYDANDWTFNDYWQQKQKEQDDKR